MAFNNSFKITMIIHFISKKYHLPKLILLLSSIIREMYFIEAKVMVVNNVDTYVKLVITSTTYNYDIINIYNYDIASLYIKVISFYFLLCI